MAGSAQAETGGYPHADAADHNTAVYEWWVDENGDGVKQITTSETDNDELVSERGYFYRNCTDYVAWKLESLGVSTDLTRGNGHGGEWDDKRPTLSDSTPESGDAAVFDGIGHVAFVEAVNSDGTVTISEYNIPGGSGNYGVRTDTPSALGITDFVDFNGTGISLSGTSGVGTRMLDDVNGDGRDDAVVMFRDSGTASVALSTGSSFSSPATWSIEPLMTSADQYFLADVNGDGNSDLVGFWKDSGHWKVMLSNGTAFTGPPADWADGQGTGTSKQWVMDVDGDAQHKADMITFDSATGDWYVSTSTGTGFGPTQQQWADGHGYTSDDQVIADFSGDGKADAAVYFANTGTWYVANSLGTTFGGAPSWSNSHGMNSSRRHVGDVNGDNKADAAYFFAANGHWDIGTSSGSGFWPPTAWADGHGKDTTEQFLAKVNGDSMADMVTFDRNTGDWWVSASSGSGFWPPVQWITGHGKDS